VPLYPKLTISLCAKHRLRAQRLWHLQTLMVDTDNFKFKREFKKLSQRMSDQLDKEKGQ
jgi:hypothetical protein